MNNTQGETHMARPRKYTPRLTRANAQEQLAQYYEILRNQPTRAAEIRQGYYHTPRIAQEIETLLTENAVRRSMEKDYWVSETQSAR